MRIEPAYQLAAPRCAENTRTLAYQTPAKVNLFLEVIGKREDGFHEIETVMATVDLRDTIYFRARDDGQICLELIGSEDLRPWVPLDDRNLIIRALQELRQFGSKTGLGCDILLIKRIPVQAGLGGASSNAAAALLAGLKLWNLNCDFSELYKLAERLGSDVPFFLDFFLNRNTGCALCRGRGEIIEPIAGLPAGLPVVIVKPQFGLSTPAVYRQVEIQETLRRGNDMIKSVTEGDIQGVGRFLFNRLQYPAIRQNSEIEKLSRIFQQTNAIGHCLSGSGSSYFGVYATPKAARRAFGLLSGRLPNVTIFNSRTCRHHVGHGGSGKTREYHFLAQ